MFKIEEEDRGGDISDYLVGIQQHHTNMSKNVTATRGWDFEGGVD